MKIKMQIFFLLLVFRVSAQNVGIGTATPQAKLHVNGDIKIDSINLVSSALYVLVTDSNNKIMRVTFASLANTSSCFINSGVDMGPYSIEADESSAVPWFEAADSCKARGGRLPTVEEFYTACNSGNPALLNMTGNYEWTGDGGTGTTFRVIGTSGCTAISNGGSFSFNFRCCCDK